jgi:hypothetical protein
VSNGEQLEKGKKRTQRKGDKRLEF